MLLFKRASIICSRVANCWRTLLIENLSAAILLQMERGVNHTMGLTEIECEGCRLLIVDDDDRESAELLMLKNYDRTARTKMVNSDLLLLSSHMREHKTKELRIFG